MSGKKGVQHYPESLKQQIREEYLQGSGQRFLSRKYGVSRYSIARRQRIQSFEQAQQLIDDYIHFYNFARFQLKYRLTPIQKRSQTA